MYETGISYRGRTYAEGKKIGIRDAWRALYCILKYNLPKAPLPVQFVFYTAIGGVAAIVNLLCFMLLFDIGLGLTPSVLVAFFIAAGVNYYLSIKLLFRHRAKWNTITELLVYLVLVVVVSLVDLGCTRGFVALGVNPPLAKALSTLIGLVLNFVGRRFIVFPEKSNPDWKPQDPDSRRSIP